MTDRFDIVVAGAGHNSLIAAAYLARAGLRCLVLEGRPVAGGNCVTEELTLPGFRHDTCASAHVVLQDSPMLRNDELRLGDYGLEYIFPEIVVHMPFPDGSYLTQWHDLDRTCAEFAKFSKRDAATYRRMMGEFAAIKPVFDAASYTPVGFGQPLAERLGGHPDGRRWQRRIALSAFEIIRDNFEDDHCRAFMLWMATQTAVPPDQPMSGRLAYSLCYGRQRWSWCVPRGGSGALTEALARLIAQHGGLVLTGKTIHQLVVENGRCTGVECRDGTRYRAAKAVLSTIHIKHLVEMAPRGAFGDDFIDAVDTWQAGLTMFVTHYATTEPPRCPVGGGTIAAIATGILAEPTRALRMGYDFARGAVNLEDPPLLAVCPTVADPTRAPERRHTLKIIGFQPYDLSEGPEHWDAIKQDVAAAHLDYLRRFAPNLTEDRILARVVESPLDLERINPHNWRGTCHGGAQSPAQSAALRPAPGWAQHRMPIAGLYQTGSTTHPGGSISGGPGRNAAAVMLRDLGMNITPAKAVSEPLPVK
jgi:phytoene dehydrogenase-like protein